MGTMPDDSLPAPDPEAVAPRAEDQPAGTGRAGTDAEESTRMGAATTPRTRFYANPSA